MPMKNRNGGIRLEVFFAIFRKKGVCRKIQYRLPSVEEMETARKHFSEKDKLVNIRKRNPLRYKPSADSLKFILYNISEFTLSDSLYGENWKEVVPTEFPNDFTGFRCDGIT